MGSEPRQRSRKLWAITVLVPGVAFAVLAGLSWMAELVQSRSAPAAQPGAIPASAVHIRNMDNAIGQGAVRAAEANWQVAQLEARRSPTWEAWISVGDAALRLSKATGSRQEFIIHARRAYRQAMLHQDIWNSSLPAPGK